MLGLCLRLSLQRLWQGREGGSSMRRGGSNGGRSVPGTPAETGSDDSGGSARRRQRQRVSSREINVRGLFWHPLCCCMQLSSPVLLSMTTSLCCASFMRQSSPFAFPC
jgi:hypothetical protein